MKIIPLTEEIMRITFRRYDVVISTDEGPKRFLPESGYKFFIQDILGLMADNERAKAGLDFISRQEDYCHYKGLPFFMPANGVCWSCGKDMVKPLLERGMSGDEDHITGCPICHRSYCD